MQNSSENSPQKRKRLSARLAEDEKRPREIWEIGIAEKWIFIGPRREWNFWAKGFYLYPRVGTSSGRYKINSIDDD